MSNLGADYFTGDDEFNAPILLAASGRIIACHLVWFPISDRCNRGWVDGLIYQIRPNWIGAIFRERLVECIAPDSISMS
jgi:hypothetical protein